MGALITSSIDTPALLIDLDIVEANLQWMQDKANRLGVVLRPHIKTHKMPELAKRQLQIGAVGVTAAKVSEAEIMAASGISDIFIANEIVTPSKIERLLSLARRVRLTIGLDSREGARRLSEVFGAADMEIGYLIEIDSGLNRCGVRPGEPALGLLQDIRNLPGIRFRGLFTHAGHAYGKVSIEEILEVSRQESRAVVETAGCLEEAGIHSEVVSIGSTPTMKVWEGCKGVTEIRPGNYVFHDAMQVALGVAQPQDCALRVLSTVISRPASERAVIDAGSKVFALDKGAHGLERMKGFGMIPGREAVLERLSEEHGVIAVSSHDNLMVGERLCIIPNHACTVVNLFDFAHTVRGERITGRLEIAARGKVW
jgi:D-serine deaminase-like pyridoxal phosphate-dependent protein